MDVLDTLLTAFGYLVCFAILLAIASIGILLFFFTINWRNFCVPAKFHPYYGTARYVEPLSWDELEDWEKKDAYKHRFLLIFAIPIIAWLTYGYISYQIIDIAFTPIITYFSSII